MLSRRQFIYSGLSACLAACSAGLGRLNSAPNDTLKIHRRADWQARDPDLNAPNEHGLFDPQFNPEGWLMYPGALADVYNTLIVHHSALDHSYGPLQIQALHLHNKGYADIGYHFLIDEHGRVSEGRTIRARGAHTGGFNTGTIGVVLLGNFEVDHPTEAQRWALKLLGDYLSETYTLTHLAGHRDFQPTVTVCPGAHLEELLTGLADDLGLQFGTGGYVAPQWANH